MSQRRKGTAFLPFINYFHFLLVMSGNLRIRARIPYYLTARNYFSSLFTYLLTLLKYFYTC